MLPVEAGAVAVAPKRLPVHFSGLRSEIKQRESYGEQV